MEFNQQPNILDDPDDLGPPPDRAPELRREEFIDVGPQGIRSLINYDNDVQSVTFEGTVYPVQLDANNRFYRVTLMIGVSYISNFISIERLI